MRAYFAILKDSFREARASRVLWIALLGIVVVLLLLVPFNLSRERALRLRGVELAFPERLLRQLVDQKDAKESVENHIWSLLKDGEQERIQKVLSPDADSGGGRRGPRNRGPSREILNVLNRLIQEESFYKEGLWDAEELNEEVTGLLSIDGELSQEDRQRRNLLLLSATFADGIRLVDDTSVGLYYANAEIIGSLPFPPSQIDRTIEFGVTLVLGIFLGFFGIFGSLLVTAGLIPRTFEPGEVALLLSKPVNRAGLFLVKFAGGCTFTLMYASVLVVGVWLLLGTRLNYWQINLLWCIPVYVFLFMIYFSVSAVTGVIWRNPIVALVSVVLFYLGMNTVEITKTQMESEMIESRGIHEVTVADDKLFTVDGARNIYVWNDDNRVWVECMKRTESGMARLMRRRQAARYRFSPVYDPADERLLALQATAGRFTGTGPPMLVAGYQENDWERESVGRLPAMVKELYRDSDGRIVLPAQDAIFEYVGQSKNEQKRANFLQGLTGGLMGGGKAFRTIHAKGMPDFGKDFSSSFHSTSSDVFMFGKGRLCRLHRSGEDDKYSVVATANVDTQEPGVLAAAGDVCVLALRDGRVLIFNGPDLLPNTETRLEAGEQPRVCTASSDGRFIALVTHESRVTIWNAKDGRRLEWTPSERMKIRGIAFDSSGRLLASDGRLAVHSFDIGERAQQNVWAERPSRAYAFFDYIVYPLWWVLPKPADLDSFVPYVMSGETFPDDGPPIPDEDEVQSLETREADFDAAGILRANGLFIAVLLSIGCIYVSRRDF